MPGTAGELLRWPERQLQASRRDRKTTTPKPYLRRQRASNPPRPARCSPPHEAGWPGPLWRLRRRLGPPARGRRSGKREVAGDSRPRAPPSAASAGFLTARVLRGSGTTREAARPPGPGRRGAPLAARPPLPHSERAPKSTLPPSNSLWRKDAGTATDVSLEHATRRNPCLPGRVWAREVSPAPPRGPRGLARTCAWRPGRRLRAASGSTWCPAPAHVHTTGYRCCKVNTEFEF